MQSNKRSMGVSVIVAVLGVGFIVAAFATDYWIDSTPVFVSNGTRHDEGNKTIGHREASINFGLFSGYSAIDYGFSPRFLNLRIACDVSEQACAFVDNLTPLDSLIRSYKNTTNEGQRSMEWFGLFSFPLYVSTLVMLVLAIISGFLAIGFGIFNVFGRPIETITGPSGLYVWNILAVVFSAATIGTYLGLYFSQLKVNLLTPYNLDSGLSSEGHTDLYYSFFFVVAAGVSFLLNIVVLSLSGQKFSCHYSLTGEKEVDNGMILY